MVAKFKYGDKVDVHWGSGTPWYIVEVIEDDEGFLYRVSTDIRCKDGLQDTLTEHEIVDWNELWSCTSG